MTSDPPGGGDDLESRKTRFVPRPDLLEGEAAAAPRATPPAESGPQPAPADEPPSSPVLGGTVIGRTRLVGNHGAQAPSGGLSPAGGPGHATLKMGGDPVAAKTEYIRADDMQADAVAGWVVVVKGPGRGEFKPVFVGMNSVGRDDSQRVCLNFGDDAISREEHAFITYDDEQRVFYLQHGGKSNLVRLGDQPIMMPTELNGSALIRIGKTTLRFVPCCGPDFSWSDEVADA